MEDQLLGGMILRLHCMDWSALAHGRYIVQNFCLFNILNFFQEPFDGQKIFAFIKFCKILLLCLCCLAALFVIDNLMCAARYIVNWGATFSIKHHPNINVTFSKIKIWFTSYQGPLHDTARIPMSRKEDSKLYTGHR